jgi:hypothetical protein
MFQRRHYEAIAKAIRETDFPATDVGDLARYDVSVKLAETFERDNPNFDRARFLRATGAYDD